MTNRFRNALLNPSWVCFLWAGMTIGISIVATPARFSAETITRSIALDVSRDVFEALNQAELVVLVVLLVVVRLSGLAAKRWIPCIALALIFLMQATWLTPALSERTDVVIAGGNPPDSWLHATYSSIELVKIGILLWFGWSSLDRSRGAS